MLRDEYSEFIDAPFNIRIESPQAELYQIDRVQFWRDINNSKDLQMYVKEYYRDRLMHSMKRSANVDEWQIWGRLYTNL